MPTQSYGGTLQQPIQHWSCFFFSFFFFYSQCSKRQHHKRCLHPTMNSDAVILTCSSVTRSNRCQSYHTCTRLHILPPPSCPELRRDAHIPQCADKGVKASILWSHSPLEDTIVHQPYITRLLFLTINPSN